MNEYHVLNLGAGVQSTALFLLAREPGNKLRFDVCVFADTQEEPAAVAKHLDHLRSLGSPEIWVRSAGSLGGNLIGGTNSTGQRFVSIPAFTKGRASGKPSPNPFWRAPSPSPSEDIVARPCLRPSATIGWGRRPLATQPGQALRCEVPR